MYKILILLLCFVGSNNLYAQNDQYFKTPAILEMVNKADACAQQQGVACDLIYKEAAKLAKQSQTDSWGLINHKLCMYYYRANKPDSVWVYLELGLKEETDEDGVEALLNLKAQVLYNEGYSDSSINVTIALAARLEKGQKTDKLAYTYASIGNALYAQDDFEHSIQYLLKSYKLLEAIRDTVFTTTVAGNIADGYLLLKQDSLARYWAYKTLGLNKATKEYEGHILAYMTLASLAKKTQPDSALWFCDKAFELAEQNKNKERMGLTLGCKAEILFEQARYFDAQAVIEQAIAFYRAAPFLPGLASDLKIAGNISLKNKQYEKASLFFQEYIKLNDSLKSEKNFKIISELTTRYETEKKEKQLAEQQLILQNNKWWMLTGGAVISILLLALVLYRKAQKNKFQKIQQEKENAVLKAQMNGEEIERNRISKHLHDGIGAMIGAARMSVQAIPYLSKEKQDEQVNKISKILEDTHTDVRRIAHDLMPLTLQKEGLIRAVQQFTYDINDTGIIVMEFINNIEDSFRLPRHIELMLYRITQELINNIIKHAKATQATVAFSKHDNQLAIAVSDNGVGFDDVNENQGLSSIRERLRTVGGNFQIDGKERGVKAQLLLNLDFLL